MILLIYLFCYLSFHNIHFVNCSPKCVRMKENKMFDKWPGCECDVFFHFWVRLTHLWFYSWDTETSSRFHYEKTSRINAKNNILTYCKVLQLLHVVLYVLTSYTVWYKKESLTQSILNQKPFFFLPDPSSLMYAIQQQALGSIQWIIIASGLKETTYTITTLSKGVRYAFRVLTITSKAFSKPSPATDPVQLLDRGRFDFIDHPSIHPEQIC